MSESIYDDRRKECEELSAIKESDVPAHLFLSYSVLVCFKIPRLMAPQIHEESSTTEGFCTWIDLEEGSREEREDNQVHVRAWVTAVDSAPL